MPSGPIIAHTMTQHVSVHLKIALLASLKIRRPGPYSRQLRVHTVWGGNSCPGRRLTCICSQPGVPGEQIHTGNVLCWSPSVNACFPEVTSVSRSETCKLHGCHAGMKNVRLCFLLLPEGNAKRLPTKISCRGTGKIGMHYFSLKRKGSVDSNNSISKCPKLSEL